MNPTAIARRLRRQQTDDELWRALRGGRFAGFKFRRQHPVGVYYLDFYCPTAKLSVELDGFQHGLPAQRQRDREREEFLAAEGIEECASGIISGERIAKGFYWKSGRPCIGGPVV